MKKTINVELATWKKLRDFQTHHANHKQKDFDEIIQDLLEVYETKINIYDQNTKEVQL